jgi:hypothetical protein
MTTTAEAPTTTEVGTITRDDILALKAADVVSLHHYKGVGSLRCSVRNQCGGEPRIFTVTEQRLLPEVDEYERKREITVSSSVSGYVQSTMSRWYGDEHSTGFTMFHGGYRDDVLRSVVDTLRPGDVLHLDFRGDAHSNGITKPAGIHVDDVLLRVTRGNRQSTFLLNCQASLDNSARMVKRHGSF